MKRTRRLATAALALALVLPAQAAPASALPALPFFGLPEPLATPGTAGMQQALLAETNLYRASKGLAPLLGHGALDGAAQSWSETMAHQRTLQHNPDYLAAYPATWRQAAENVGTFSREVSPREMVQAWINSPSHRANLENPDFTHLGVGWAVNARGELFATQNFAAL